MDKDLMILPYAESIFVGNTTNRMDLSIRKRTLCTVRVVETIFFIPASLKSVLGLANNFRFKSSTIEISAHSKA